MSEAIRPYDKLSSLNSQLLATSLQSGGFAEPQAA